MVTETDDITRAVLMDFGIARLMEPDAEDQSLTSSGELVGSPRYMSPEQGESGKKVDERTDQYSLGCLIFEMLTGNVPLSGDTAFDTIKMRQTQEAPRLSEMSLSEIPQALDDLVARLLAREPANRFASMKEVTTIAENLLDEIAAHLDEARRAALFDILDDLDFQCFMTGTDASLFDAWRTRAQAFNVSNGVVCEIG